MSRRAHISLETKLASALLSLGHVPYDDAKQMSAKQIISLYTFDHGILHAIKVVDEYWNLTPRLIAPHRRKSAGDTAIVAKVKRLARANDAAVNRLLAKPCAQKRQRTGNWPQGRKIQSRGFSR